MGSSTNWSWVTANGGWTLTVTLELCRTELAFNFTCRERLVLKRTAEAREENSRGHSPVRSPRGRAAPRCQESELPEKKEGKPWNPLFLHQRSSEKVTESCLFTDGSSMLEDTATLTVRSSWVEDLGRMSAIRAEHWKTLPHQQLRWKRPGGLGVPTPYPASWWLLWLTSAAFSSQPPPARNQPPGHPLWVWRKTMGRCPCRSRGGARLSWGWLPPPSAPLGGEGKEDKQWNHHSAGTFL